MDKQKILETAGQELSESARKSKKAVIEGVKSNLLDALIEDNNPNTRKKSGEIIKKELKAKKEIAEKKKNQKYADNLTKIIADLDKRIQGETIDKERPDVLNLDRKGNAFNKTVLKKITEEIIAEAKNNDKIHLKHIFKKATKHPEHIEEIVMLLEQQKDTLTDPTQKKNIEDLIGRLQKKKKTQQEIAEDLKKKLIDETPEEKKEAEIDMKEIEAQYTSVFGRRDILKGWMDDFDKNLDINADTPLFQARFIPLEQQINGFKKDLENASIDIDAKIEESKKKGDQKSVKKLEIIKEKYEAIKKDYEETFKQLNERIHNKTHKQIEGKKEEPKQKPKPEPKKPEEYRKSTDIPEQEEVIATISNTYQIRYADAERKAGMELREKRAKTSRWNAPQKLNLFLRRKAMKENIIDKELKYTDFEKSGKLNRDKDTTAATDRHQIEEQEKFNENIENVLGKLEGFEENYPNTFKEIRNLVGRFTGTQTDNRTGTIDETKFEKEFEDILQKSSVLDSDRPTTASMPETGKGRRRKLHEVLTTNDMYQISTNLLDQIITFKAEKKLVYEIDGVLADQALLYPNFANDQKDMDALSKALDTGVRPMIAKYVREYKLMPKFLKTLKLNLDDPNVMKDLTNYRSHNMSLRNIEAQTMKLKLQILNKGEEAYNVEEKKNRLGSFGRWLDDPFDKNNKVTLGGKQFGRYLERHPGMRKFMKTVRGVTKLAAMVTPGAVTMGLGAPLRAYSTVYGATAFGKTLFAKYSHYNKEHKLYQKTQANELNETRNERKRIADTVTGMHRWEGRFRGKKMRLRRQLKYYIKTTHDQIKDSNDLIVQIENFLTKNTGPLTTGVNSERETLTNLTADALARLDFHKYNKETKKGTGQNFLGSQSPLKSEEEYQTLQKLVLTSANRLNMDLATVRQEQQYATVTKTIKEGTGNQKEYFNQGYETAKKRFKQREWQQAYLGATKAGVAAFGMSYIMGSLTGKGAKEAHDTTTEAFKSEYALGKYDDSTYVTGNLQTDLTNFLNTTNASTSGQLNVVVTGSTDATQVMAGSVLSNPAALTAYKADIISHINSLVANGSIPSTYGTSINGFINSHVSSMPATFTGHESDILASMRTLTGAKELADSLASTTNPAFHTGAIPLNLEHVGTAASNTAYNQSDRFVAAAIQYTNNTQIPGSPGFGVGIGRDNTFALNNLGEKHTQEDIKRKRTGEEDQTRFGKAA